MKTNMLQMMLCAMALVSCDDPKAREKVEAQELIVDRLAEIAGLDVVIKFEEKQLALETEDYDGKDVAEEIRIGRIEGKIEAARERVSECRREIKRLNFKAGLDLEKFPEWKGDS